MSTKAVSKQLKTKGLQRLRWYCQLCEKQCRDENGFKCHSASPAHINRLAVFAQNQRKVVDGFSERFRSSFISELALNCCNSRVEANKFYNQLIANKGHVRMNATRWTSLTEFVRALAAEGVCEIDETDKGIFIRYSLPESNSTLRESSARKRMHADETADKKHQQVVRDQLKRTGAAAISQETRPTSLDGSSVKFKMDLNGKEKRDEDGFEIHATGIVVRLRSSKKKYVITALSNGIAELRCPDSADSFTAPIKDLQTVIPAAGNLVKVVRGPSVGRIGMVSSINPARNSVQVCFDGINGPLMSFAFSHVSKFFDKCS
ncbi:KOW [Ostreococcus tauri]|uniref:KOW n=1 Tax=Ostreococcus tauri TaxID=70448 RepID=A0A090N4M8_OSTTA|nr:KOW [Ostreococcus tauri]CEG00985.1 KOW [Ostreococcus tauri]|eukprot:XP_022840722.1 KOW [Ostreococcus tauri]